MTIYTHKKTGKLMRSIQVYLSEEDHEKVHKLANKEDRSVASYVRTLVGREVL